MWRWLLAAGVAWGCSCMPRRPACEMFAETFAVFSGTVVEARPGMPVYRVRVDEAFSGLAKGEREVLVNGGYLSPCGTTYEVGKQYLFFSSGVKGMLKEPAHIVGMCSGSRVTKDAAEDLRWLRARLRGENRTRVYGRVLQNDTDVPLAGASVRLREWMRSREAISGVEGEFSFDGIEASSYTLTAERYPWTAAAVPSFEVAVGGCAERMLRVGVHGSMQGMVLRHDGTPARRVTLQLVRLRADRSLADEVSVWGQTDERGAFLLRDVPAGEFVLGVNIRRAPTADLPWSATFYPGVGGFAEARIFPLRPHENVSGMQLLLPPPLAVRTAHVRVLWANGKQANGARVAAYTVDKQESVASFTPAVRENLVAVWLLRGFSYQLKAAWWPEMGPEFVESELVLLPAGNADVNLTIRLKGNGPGR